jgi:Tol biopolymer transport system component
MEFPFDPGGRSLNSPATELQPQIVDRYLVFVSDRRGSQDIFLFDAVDRQLIDLPGLNALDAIASHPSISEDGKYIIFQATRQGKSGIYLYDRQLFQVRNLTENLGAEVRHPVISANGGTIAFETAINGTWHISLVDRSGQPLNLPTLPR